MLSAERLVCLIDGTRVVGNACGRFQGGKMVVMGARARWRESRALPEHKKQ